MRFPWATHLVVGFQYQDDAIAGHAAIRKRFGEYGLVLHPEKTRVIEFGSYAGRSAIHRGESKPATFDFLGFTHICGVKHGNGMFTIKRRTMRKRKHSKIREVKEELRRRRSQPIREQGKYLRSVLAGHDRYFGVPGNEQSLFDFHFEVTARWWKSLSRRSQNGDVPWHRMKGIAERHLPKPTIHHPYPLERMGVTTQGKSRMR